MVWNDTKIKEWAISGGVTPFDEKCINPASYDLRLGNQIKETHPIWDRLSVIDMKNHIANGTIDDLPKWTGTIAFDTYWLFPRRFVLCHSLEFVNIPEDAIALLFSKSSTGRIGLEHLHAGYGDCGFKGQWTWELHNVAPWPIKLEAGKRLMQHVVIKMTDPPLRSYAITGRYQGQTGATEAREER